MKNDAIDSAIVSKWYQTFKDKNVQWISQKFQRKFKVGLSPSKKVYFNCFQ